MGAGLVQGSAKRPSPSLVNFVAALAYHFCLALPAEFTHPGAHLLAEPCIYVTSEWVPNQWGKILVEPANTLRCVDPSSEYSNQRRRRARSCYARWQTAGWEWRRRKRRRGSNTMAKGEREWDSRNPPAQTRVTAEPPPSPPVKEVRKYCGFPHRHHFLMQRWTCCSNFNDNFGTTLQLHVLIVKTRAAASNFLFVWVVSCISDKPLEVWLRVRGGKHLFLKISLVCD